MSSDSGIRVMVVDDHEIVREGLKQILEQAGGFEIVGQAGDGAEAVRVAEEIQPDIIVMDILMPVLNGIEACRQIVAKLPDTRVLMLTASNAQDAIAQSVSAGANGYLQKYSTKERFLSTVLEVSSGEFRVQGEAARRLIAGIGGEGATLAPSESGNLTLRERDILRMFAQGKSYADIAEVRGNTPLTVRNYIYDIQRKIGVKTRQEMGVWAARSGLLD